MHKGQAVHQHGGKSAPPSREERLIVIEQACDLAMTSVKNSSSASHNKSLIVRLNIDLLELHKQTGRMAPEAWRRACETQIRLWRGLPDLSVSDKLKLAAIIRQIKAFDAGEDYKEDIAKAA